MRRSKVKIARRRGNGGLTLLTVLGIGGVACLLAGWNANAPRGALSPAEVVALRFPDSRNDVFDEVGSARAEATDVDDIDAKQYSLFSPYPTMMPATTAATNAPATFQVASLGSTPVELAPREAAPATRAKIEPKTEAKPATKPSEPKMSEAKPAHVKPAVPPKRPGAVLSEGQIASIKTRLNLTPDQQQMWPAVEQALRSLNYAKKEDGGRGFQAAAAPTRTTEIDPYSDEVQRLKSAAFPLIMSFSDEQKRELRILAHVAGLEKLATQF